MPSPPEADDTDSEVELGPDDDSEDGETLGDELVAQEGEELEEEDEGLASPGHGDADPQLPNLEPPPPHLREISTLASWTVSSSKPGCSIPQLRHPSTNLFWQSDGPQPHYLNIHFFKLVRIVGMRLYLDFEQDESYTPTKIIFLAGSGMNDLQEWGELKLESPRGWVWADFTGVGDPESDDEEGDEGGAGDEGEDGHAPQRMLIDPPTTTTNGRTGGRNDASSDSENAAPREDGLATQAPYDTTPLPSNGHPGPYAMDTPTYTSSPSIHLGTTPALNLTRPTPRQPFTSLSPNPAPPRPPPSTRQRAPKMPVLRAHLVQVKILENHQNGKDTHLRALQIFARNDEDIGRSDGMRGAAAELGAKAVTGGMDLVKREKKARKVREERYELGRSAWDMDGDIR
jgi:anaphase-promoting complex subunit 10